MKTEWNQHSLVAATKEIERFAATRRVTPSSDLLREESGGYAHRRFKDKRDHDLDDPEKATPEETLGSARLLDITA